MKELSQAIYEIAMSIGNDLDMDKMCGEVAVVTMQKLDCSAFAVFAEKRVMGDKYVFNNVYLSPDSFASDKNYETLLASIPQDLPRDQKNKFYTDLPLQFKHVEKAVWHLMELPGFGLLALFSEKGSLSDDMVVALKDVNKKLAMACFSCREHVHLLTSERKYKLVMKAMNEGVVVIDPKKIIRFVNDGVCRFLGKNSSDLTGQLIVADYMDEKNKRTFLSAIEECNDEGFIQRELVWTKQDGRQLETLTSVTPSIDDEGVLTGYTVVITDLTMQKQAEKEALKIQKMEAIGKLAGGIAHDFNNMLAVIMGNVSYALTKIDHNDEIFTLLSDAEKATVDAQKLTHQMLTFAKGGEPVTETTDINIILKDSVEFLLRGSNVACEFDLQDDIPGVDVDTGQINQVINNLVINAKQAMPMGGTLLINTGTENIKANNQFSLPAGNYVKIKIQDHGIGIPEEHLKNIFEPFFTTKQDGNGLGLATTYSIIRKHHGAITVDSKIGKGTSFCIYLRESLKTIPEKSIEKNISHKTKGRILVMDDNDLMLKVIGAMLKDMGYDETLTTDGRDALAAYQEAAGKKKPFDLVILDLTVPGGMGGAETMTELLKINPEVKAVVASGYSNDPIMANYAEHGFSGVMAKPFNMDELAKTIKSVLFT